ncbi:hypothetical protein THAOC_22696, partial [Thalassiosira oceanica]
MLARQPALTLAGLSTVRPPARPPALSVARAVDVRGPRKQAKALSATGAEPHLGQG